MSASDAFVPDVIRIASANRLQVQIHTPAFACFSIIQVIQIQTACVNRGGFESGIDGGKSARNFRRWRIEG